MDPALMGLLAAAIGAISGLAGGSLAGWQEARLEYKKWLRARDDETNRELRLAIADVMKKMATAAQIISWFTWEADYYPDRMTDPAISDYDLQMKQIFPQIEAALIMVSAFSSKAYQRISPLVGAIYDLDLKVSREIRSKDQERSDAIRGVAAYRGTAFQLRREIMERVSDIANTPVE